MGRAGVRLWPASRARRRNPISCRVEPSSASSARISPTTLANLNPCPENPPRGRRSRTRDARRSGSARRGCSRRGRSRATSSAPRHAGSSARRSARRSASSAAFGSRSKASGSTRSSRWWKAPDLEPGDAVHREAVEDSLLDGEPEGRECAPASNSAGSSGWNQASAWRSATQSSGSSRPTRAAQAPAVTTSRSAV